MWQTRKLLSSGRLAVAFQRLAYMIRTLFEQTWSSNDSQATIPAYRAVYLTAGNGSSVLLSPDHHENVFGITEQAILAGANGWVRTQGITWLELDADATSPQVGMLVMCSEDDNGKGTVNQAVVNSNSRIGTVYDMSTWTVNNRFVRVIVRGCHCYFSRD